MLSLFDWIQSIGFLAAIRESAMVYPLIMATHLSCIALFGGMILMTDMRLLGLGLKRYTVAEVVNALRTPKRVGFIIMVSMGLLLGSSEAVKYYHNPFFWAKMSFLACVGIHAIIFRPTVYNNPAEIDKAPALPSRAKAAAVLSLVIWTGVLTMGRLIGYYEGDKTQQNAQVQLNVAENRGW